MISTKKVAEIAGVSRSTVQRALTGHPNVKKTTREKIQKIAESLGYKPNKTAKALVMRQQKLKYGVIFSSANNPFYLEELRGINTAGEELKEYGVDIEVVFLPGIDAAAQAAMIDKMVAQGIKGITMDALDSPDVKEAIGAGIETGVQFVTITSDIEDTDRLCYVGWDHYRGGRTAGGLMRWLVSPGEKVAVIIGSMQFRAHRKRVEGFRNAFTEDRAAADIVAILENNDNSDRSELLIEKLFVENPDIKGLYLGGAGVEGVCSALKQMKIDQDIRVICFDRLESHNALCREGVIDAVIDQEPFEQGYRAMTILNNYIMFGELPPDRVLSKIDIRTKENIDL